MADMFDQVASQMTADHATSSPESTVESNQELPSERAAQPEASTEQQQAVEQALAELDKMEKFKFEGQEWTPQTLKDAMLRWKDYTTKTSKLSEERKSFEAEREAERNERQFAEKLHIDLEAVRQNPALATEFFKIYPQKYHSAVRAILGSSSQGQSSPQAQSTPDYKADPEYQWAIQTLKTQEVKTYESQIRQELDTALKSAGLEQSQMARVIALSQAEQLKDQGVEINASVWSEIAREISQMRKSEFDQSYGELVKQQTSANSKGQDVPPGGGIVGKAPKKFKNFDELNQGFFDSVSR